MSTRPHECGSCGTDHPSSDPCREQAVGPRLDGSRVIWFVEQHHDERTYSGAYSSKDAALRAVADDIAADIEVLQEEDCEEIRDSATEIAGLIARGGNADIGQAIDLYNRICCDWFDDDGAYDVTGLVLDAPISASSLDIDLDSPIDPSRS